ncbi:MAG: lysoplasmalogenase family protein, partial [Clostridia bacterium]
IVGILAVILNKQRGKYSYLILVGLVFGFFGDLLLALSLTGGEILFVLGMALFLMNHVMFVAALYSIDGFKLREVLIAVGIYAFLMFFMIYNDAKMENLTIPVFVYMATLAALIGKSISVHLSKKMTELCGFLLVTGVIMWAISDIILGLGFIDPYKMIRNICKSITYKTNPKDFFNVLNTVTYFLGQTLVACTVYYHKKKQI